MADYVNVKFQDQSTASGSSLKRKYNVARKTQESPLLLELQNANVSSSLDDVNNSYKANHQSRNTTSHKSKEPGYSNALHQKYSNKSLHQQSNSMPGKSSLVEATVVRQKDNNGTHDLANATGSRKSIQVRVNTFQLCLKFLNFSLFLFLDSEIKMFFRGLSSITSRG